MGGGLRRSWTSAMPEELPTCYHPWDIMSFVPVIVLVLPTLLYVLIRHTVVKWLKTSRAIFFISLVHLIPNIYIDFTPTLAHLRTHTLTHVYSTLLHIWSFLSHFWCTPYRFKRITAALFCGKNSGDSYLCRLCADRYNLQPTTSKFD